MDAPRTFALPAFPPRLRTSLLKFAAAGTLLAAAVAADGTVGGRWLPPFLLATAWGLPGAFALQVRRAGFDPLASLTLADDGLLATYRDGTKRLLPWRGMAALVREEGFRKRAWEIRHADAAPLRWFGELAELSAFEDALADRTGLRWTAASGSDA
jgi:hypothetical protein